MPPKTGSKPSQKQKRINPTNKGGKPASTPQIPGDLTAIVQDFHGHFLQIGDRVQGAWVAGAGYRGVIESFSGRKKIIAHGTWIEGRRAGDGDRFSVSARMLIRLPEEEGWNESEEGQNFWDRFELLKPYLSKANLQTGYFDRSLDYPRSFEWLETLEGKRQMVLPLEPVNMQTSTQAEELPLFSVGDRVQVIKGCCKGHVSTIENIDQTLKHSVQLKGGGRYSPSFLELVMDTPEEQIAAICREGPIAPDGVWIETGKVSGKAFRQAWYRSRSPCFAPARKGDLPKKTQYLGAVGGDRHKEAVKAIERRNKLKKLKKIAQQKAG